jgi:hypothetical protein
MTRKCDDCYHYCYCAHVFDRHWYCPCPRLWRRFWRWRFPRRRVWRLLSGLLWIRVCPVLLLYGLRSTDQIWLAILNRAALARDQNPALPAGLSLSIAMIVPTSNNVKPMVERRSIVSVSRRSVVGRAREDSNP